MKKLLLTLILFVLLTSGAGCSSTNSTATPAPFNYATQPGSSNESEASGQSQPLTQVDFDRDALATYSAEFRIDFNGTAPWSYQLAIRKSVHLREVSLHMEGLPLEQNPGDIRLVTDGVQSWMTGASTGGECVQFPNGQGMDPEYLYPETLVAMDVLSGALQWVADEPGDVNIQHFQATLGAAGPWTNASVNLWKDESSGLRQFTMQADGDDPYFGTGVGKVLANYKVTAIEEPVIEPVTGCEAGVPLPSSVSNFVRLPGLFTFNSQSSAVDIANFFQTTLPQENWTEIEPAAPVDGATVLSYHKDSEELQVAIEEGSEGGSKVRLIFIKSQ